MTASATSVAGALTKFLVAMLNCVASLKLLVAAAEAAIAESLIKSRVALHNLEKLLMPLMAELFSSSERTPPIFIVAGRYLNKNSNCYLLFCETIHILKKK